MLGSRGGPVSDGRNGVLRWTPIVLVITYLITLVVAVERAHGMSAQRLRSIVYRTHPCLAHIIDHEDGTWDPTRYGAGNSYGLPQAQPPEKMRSAGKDWRTNPWTQIRWMRGYVRARYGGECNAWVFWQAHSWY